MQKTTITNLVEALRTAIEANSAGTEIDFKSIEAAVTKAVQEAVLSSLGELSLGRNPSFKSAVVEVLNSHLPGRM